MVSAMRVWATVLFLPLIACDSGGTKSETSPAASVVAKAPRAVRATVRPNPRNAIGALVNVVAPGASVAWVEHGDRDAPPDLKTRPVPVDGEGRATVPIIGLSPTVPTRLRALARFPGGHLADSEALTFQAGGLPPVVPASIEVTTRGTADGDFLLVSFYDETTEEGLPAVFDRNGRLRWYWLAPPPASPAGHFDRVRGHFLVIDPSIQGWRELDLASKSVRTWFNPIPPGRIDEHEFVLLPSGNALLIGWDPHVVDTRSAFPSGVAEAERVDGIVTEVDPDGKSVFRWSTRDHVALDEVIPNAIFDPSKFESVHWNSIDVLPNGDLVASFRATSSVMKIDKKTGRILWRLGGTKSNFSFVGDPLGGFSRQHDARFVSEHEVTLFDNGHAHRPPTSRAVSYRLDEAAWKATLTWEYRLEAVSKIGGSARRLANGNTLIGEGTGRIVEVDAEKNVVWEAKTPFVVYRAISVPSLYP